MLPLTAPHATAPLPRVTRAPSTATDEVRSAPSQWRLIHYVLLVTVVAVLLRVIGLESWSLWEDEEGSLTRAHENLSKGFQGYFPLFFIALKQYADWVGMSVAALRLLPATAGLLSIVFAMTGFRRQLPPRTAALAGLLLAINIGHLFFSQSIRYYTTALVFQVLALTWFFDGFESGRAWKLLLSLVALVLALLTHFSSLLLGPVFVGYLLLTALLGERGGGYKTRWYIGYGSALAAVGAYFSWRMLLLQREMIGDWAIPEQRDPVHVGTTVVAYFGVPLLGLGLLAPLLARDLPRRVLFILLTIGVVPVLELITLAAFNFVNVTWYYGFVAMIGFALAAAASVMGVWTRGYPRIAAGLVVVSVGYYAYFLGLYYTTAHGDRPRWEEAAQFLQREYGVRPGNPDAPPVFSNVPGPVAFYLGEHPRSYEPSRVIQRIPSNPAELPAGGVYVVEERQLSPAYRVWFASRCERTACFEAHTGPVDRSVSVFVDRTPRSNPPAALKSR